MVTKAIFMAIVTVVLLQRLFELRISQRNQAYMLAQGGLERGSNYLWAVKVLQMSWFGLMVTEVWCLERPWSPALAAIALMAVLAGQHLRHLSMQALGQRWTLSIVTIPGAPVVDSGIYHYLRHPNWLGVILEIAALPLVHGAYLTAIFFSLANAFLLAKRIHTEEQALSLYNNYAGVFAGRPRFIPSSEIMRVAKSLEITIENGLRK